MFRSEIRQYESKTSSNSRFAEIVSVHVVAIGMNFIATPALLSWTSFVDRKGGRPCKPPLSIRVPLEVSALYIWDKQRKKTKKNKKSVAIATHLLAAQRRDN